MMEIYLKHTPENPAHISLDGEWGNNPKYYVPDDAHTQHNMQKPNARTRRVFFHTRSIPLASSSSSSNELQHTTHTQDQI